MQLTAAAPSTVGWRDHFVTVLMGTWLMIGLFIDGWAHNTLDSSLETFFTPWHAAFYSGFLACAAWMSWLVIRNMRQGLSGIAAIPTGYGLGLLGLVLFGVGGFGDMLWHIIFGIEADVEALLSPTHLLLFIGGALMMSSPARAAWQQREAGELTLKQFLPTLMSITVTTAFMAFMNMYYWGLNRLGPFAMLHQHIAKEFTGAAAEEISGSVTINTLIAILPTTIMLVAPLLLMMRRWTLPLGTVTFYMLVINVLMSALQGFGRAEITILVPVMTGLLGDIMLAAFKPSGENVGGLRAFGTLFPLFLWGLYMVIGGFRWGMEWPLELSMGITVMAGLTGFGLSVLVAPEGARTYAS